MSCYKSLLVENEALREQLSRAYEDIERLKAALRVEADWINPQAVVDQLNDIALPRPSL